MKALPSIAFNDYSGSAKDVTARSTSGGTIISVRSYPSKVYSPNQKIQRNNLSKISRAYKQLTDSQMKSWEGLAKHLKATSYLGSSAEMTAHNAFVRININRSLAGEHLLKDAPSHIGLIPNVALAIFRRKC